MTFTKKLLGLACLCAALIAGTIGLTRVFTDEPQAASNADKLDTSFYKVLEGQDANYYRERLVQLGEPPKYSIQRGGSHEQFELFYADLQARGVIWKNLMNDSDTEPETRDEYFKNYVFLLLTNLQIDELENLCQKEADEKRRDYLDNLLYWPRLRAAAKAKDKAGLKKSADLFVERVLKGDFIVTEVSSTYDEILKTDEQLANETLKTIAESFTKNDDPKSQGYAKQIEGLYRLKTLVGNEMKLEGITLDDKTFDWSAYRGKVVLVNFFSHWIGEIGDRDELPKIYQKYRGAGFEIVGFSLLDDDFEAVKNYASDNHMTWTILSEKKTEAAKDENGRPQFINASEYYGFLSTNVAILVGADGKVLDIDAHKEKLTRRLQELFPNVQ